MRKTAVVAALLLVTTGCYSYVPAEFQTVPIGEGVRVFLSREGVQQLRDIGGDEIPGARSDQPVVEGTLVRRTPADFSLLIPVTSRQVGFLQSEMGQQVTLPLGTAVQVQLRKVSQVKTGLALAGSTAAIAFVIVSIIKGARQPIDHPDPGGDGDFRFPPLVRVP